VEEPAGSGGTFLPRLILAVAALYRRNSHSLMDSALRNRMLFLEAGLQIL
jgi:hypothetical protein